MAGSNSPAERVTVTMPSELVAGIDRIERNRSRFIAEAVRHELQRRQRQELLRSLDATHPDTAAIASLGLSNWSDGLPAVDDGLTDPATGVAVRWTAGQGWDESEP